MVQQQFCNSRITCTHQNHLFWNHWKLLLYTLSDNSGWTATHLHNVSSPLCQHSAFTIDSSPLPRLTSRSMSTEQPHTANLSTDLQFATSLPVCSPKASEFIMKYPNRYKEDIPSWNSPLSHSDNRTRALYICMYV